MNNKPKVFILGIDGGTYDLIDPWVEKGYLPNFKRMREKGTKTPLITTIPPLTPSAWTSFMTGTSPAKHKVLDFYWLDENFNVRVSLRDRSVKTIWRILSEAGKKVISIAVPFTYPPEPVNGIMVSGFLSPSLDSNFTYPDSFREELLRNVPDYMISEDAKYSNREEDQEAFADSVFKVLDSEFKTMQWLLDKKDWDIFMITFIATDHSQHWFWKYMDRSHPLYTKKGEKKFGDVILKVYKKIDDVLGFLMGKLSEDTHLLIMSDHGAGAYYGSVYLNNFLRRKGFLKLKANLPNIAKQFMYLLNITPQNLAKLALSLGFGKTIAGMKSKERKQLASKLGFTYKDIDWKNTYAYSFGYYGPIYINTKERSTFGKVAKSDYEKVRREIIESLRELKDPIWKKPLITKIWKREEIYGEAPGLFLPDIIISMGDFSYTSSMFAFPSNRIFSESMTYKSGDHRINGVFAIKGPGIKKDLELEQASIVDVTPTIIEIFHLPQHENFDGKVLYDIFE